jgi:archaellum component FlaC
MMSRDQMRSEAAKRHGLNLNDTQLNDLYGGKDVSLPSFKMAGFGDTDNVNNVNDSKGGSFGTSSVDTNNVNSPQTYPGQTYNSKLPNAYDLATGYKPEENTFTVNGLAPGESSTESTVSGLGNWNPYGDRASRNLGSNAQTVLPDNLELPDPTILPSLGADQGSGGSNPLFNSGQEASLPGPDITNNAPGANLGNPTNESITAAPFDFGSAMTKWAESNPNFFSPSVTSPDVNVQGGLTEAQLQSALGNQGNPNASGINSILANQQQFGQNQGNFMKGVGDDFNYTNKQINQGFDALDPRLNAIDNNIGGINRNVGDINANLGNVNTGIAGLGNQFSDFGNSFDRFNNQYTADSGAMQQGLSDSLTNQQGISSQLGSLNKDMFGQGGFGGMNTGFQNMGGRFDQIGGQLAGYNNQLFGDPNAQGYGAQGNRGAIGDMGANMGAGFADMGSQLGQGFGGLNNSITGMNDQLFGNSQQMGQFDLMGQGMDRLGNQFGQDMTDMGNRFNTGMMDMGDQFGTDLNSLGDTFTNQFGQMVDPLTAGITGMNSQLGGQASYMNAIDAQIRNLQNLIPTLDQIEGVMPNQMDMTDLVSSGNLDDIAKQINTDFADYDDVGVSTMEDANKNVDWQGSTNQGFTDQQIANPELDMPAIQDYTGAMRVPLIENVLNRVGGANPYDTRQNEILNGQERSLDKNYDDAIERVKNQFAVTDDLGSPAYRAAIREVEEGRARDKTAVQSQFQMQAAGLDESMSRGRLQDLSSALGGEQGRVYQEMGMQDQLQRNANNDYLNYMNQLQASYYEPQRQRDEGLRYSLAGLGNSAQPNIGAAIQGYGSAAESQGNLANTLYAQGGGMFNNLMKQPAFQ